MSTSHPNSTPPSIRALDRIPDSEYNFVHRVEQEAPVPAAIVIWNMIDFAHVNFVHRKLYHHCKVLAASGKVHLIEYGVNQFFFLRLPVWFRHLMWHEFVPPRTVRHISKAPWGGYTKVEVTLVEFVKEGKTHTRLDHAFYLNLPLMLKPLSFLFARYINVWSSILWNEDSTMLLRRQKVLDAGFKDHPLDALVGTEGFYKHVA